MSALRTLLALLVLAALAGSARCEDAAAAPGGDVGEYVARATESFRAAKDASGIQARGEAFQQAARLYERALATGAAAGHANGALEYNTGNAWLLGGDVGRAILHYRRALLLRPGDPRVEANLAAARAQRADRIEDEAGRAAAEVVFFWYRGLSYRAKLQGAALFWALGLGLVAVGVRRFGRRQDARRLWWTGGVALTVAIALGVTFLVERHERGRRDAAVVLAPETELRKGDGLSYPVRYENPLHAGAEVRVLEERPGWVEVELRDGKTGWLPAAHIERI